mgnify:CR=1 FL=1
MKKTILLAATLAASIGAAAQGQVNIICSVQADWCNMMATVYSRTTGTKVNMSMKGSGEALAQLIAEKDNPKTDIWFGGTGDPHLQAAEQGLTLEYKSPQLAQLYPWAQKQAADSKYRTVGVYLGPLGFGYNKELLAKRKALPKDVQRVTFNAITKAAVTTAMANPRGLDTDLIDAYLARRALDYLFGFTLSPVLWRKVQRGLSAGRVQSPALRMIVEREEEIEAFIAREYWTVEAECAHPSQPFSAKLTARFVVQVLVRML